MKKKQDIWNFRPVFRRNTFGAFRLTQKTLTDWTLSFCALVSVHFLRHVSCPRRFIIPLKISFQAASAQSRVNSLYFFESGNRCPFQRQTECFICICEGKFTSPAIWTFTFWYIAKLNWNEEDEIPSTSMGLNELAVAVFFSFWTIHNIADWEQSPQISSWWQRFPFHTMNSHRLLNSYCRDTIVVFEELTYWRLITRLVRRENCVSSNNRTEQFLSVFYLVTASNFLCFCFYWIFSMSTGLLTY